MKAGNVLVLLGVAAMAQALASLANPSFADLLVQSVCLLSRRRTG